MSNHRDHLIYLLGKSEMYLITFPNLTLQLKPTQGKYCLSVYACDLCGTNHRRQIFSESLNGGVAFSPISLDLLSQCKC